MRTNVASELPLNTVIHMVHFGMCACSMEMPPAKWPPNHSWSSDWEDVTCPACLAAKDYPPTFELIDGGKAIKCRRCGLVSHNPKDVERHYCGHCHVYHDDLWPPARKRWVESV